MRRRFTDVAVEMRPEIHRIAHGGRQRIPGMTPDDVEAEMLVVLWRARIAYRKSSGVTFPAYWWACWVNRKRDLLTYWLRDKRDHRKQLLFDDEIQTALEAAFPTIMGADDQFVTLVLPDEYTNQQQAVWTLLAAGMPLSVLRKQLGTGLVNSLLEQWKSDPQIRKMLTT